MSRLVIVVDVDDVDPTLVDPHEVFEGILDTDEFNHTVAYRFVSAEWAAGGPVPTGDEGER